MNYFRPEQTFYRVRIKGLDETWRVLARYNSGGLVDSRGLLHLPMVALKPGSYVVEVQASMVPDRWDMEPYQWVINVNEPWWRTTGVLLLFVLLLLILLGINTYYYIKNVGMRANRNAQERGVVRQIRRFAEHCSRQDSVVLELPSFYQLILGNIYKSPRPMAKTLMLRKAEHLLTTTEKEVEEIASECGFISPNYFIGTFYHEHQMTPEVYRQKNSRLRQAFRFS